VVMDEHAGDVGGRRNIQSEANLSRSCAMSGARGEGWLINKSPGADELDSVFTCSGFSSGWWAL
jgi:hypothetical protein